MRLSCLLLLLLLAPCAQAGPESSGDAPAATHSADLAPAVRVLVAGKPIDVDTGHAAPALHDWDGDGVRDLLVGQFGDGKLRIYKNFGTDKAPRYFGFEYFRAGGQDATIPSG
jgi:hypothetical protein